MNTEEFIEAVEEMPIEVTRSNFEALMALALSIEEEGGEQPEQQEEAW